MLKQDLLIVYRNFKRNKSWFTINLIDLCFIYLPVDQ